MMQTLLDDIFFNTDMIGYIGPLALVAIGAYIMKKDRVVGFIYFVVECLFIAQYVELVGATPDYWWHIYIILFGGLFTFVYPLWDR